MIIDGRNQWTRDTKFTCDSVLLYVTCQWSVTSYNASALALTPRRKFELGLKFCSCHGVLIYLLRETHTVLFVCCLETGR